MIFHQVFVFRVLGYVSFMKVTNHIFRKKGSFSCSVVMNFIRIYIRINFVIFVDFNAALLLYMRIFY